jgi:hypothetical protein
MGGLTFKLRLSFSWDAGEKGAKIGLYLMPQNVPRGAIYSCSFSAVVHGGRSNSITTPMLASNTGRGWPDFFDVGAMAGGWDEAAWAAEGLPTSGELIMTATITSVSHSKPK